MAGEGSGDDICQYQESIIENAHVMMVVLDSDGTIRVWNRAAEEITGYKGAEVLDSREIWKKLYPDPKYRREITAKIKEILSRNTYFENLETIILAKDGSSHTIAWNTRNFEAKTGVQAIAVGRDITELKQAQEQLAEANEFRERIIENAHVMMMVLDPDGTIRIWNKAAEEITGYKGAEVLDSREIWKKLYPDPKYRREITAKIKEILSRNTYFEDLETVILAKDGSSHTLAWNTRNFMAKTGVQAIAVGRDITELKQAQEWLASLNEFREAVIHNAHILIAVLDRSGTIHIWNRAAEEITGYLTSEVSGNRTVWKLLYPEREYRRMVTERIKRSIEEKGSFENLETAIQTRDGSRRIISWNTQEIPSDDDFRIIAVGWDVTDQKEAELALVSYMSEAAMRLKNPVEIIEDNLNDICSLIRSQQIGIEDILSLLDIQARNAGRIVANLHELQSGIAERSASVPDSYRTFLMK